MAPPFDPTARALEGDPAAWNALVREHDPAVQAYVRRRWLAVVRFADTADIAQEAWMRLVRRVRDGISGRRPRLRELRLPSLAIAQARWVALELLARKAGRLEIATDGDDPDARALGTPETALIDREELSRALRAVESLPHRDRLAWELRYRDDRDFDEIAQIMDISPGAVRMAISRARRRVAGEQEVGA